MARPSIVRDYGTEVLRIGSTLARGFILTPVLIASFGDEGFGLWKFIETVMIYVAFLEPCVRGALSRFLAVSVGQADRKTAARVLASSVLILFPIIVAMIVVVMAFAPWIIERSQPGDPGLARSGVLALRLLAVGAMFASIAGYATAMLQSLRRFDLANAVGVPMMWCGLGAGLLVLWFGGGLVEMALVGLLQSVISAVLSSILAVRLCIVESVIDRASLRPAWIGDLAGFSAKSAVARLGDLFRTDSTMLLLGVLVSLEVAAMFAAVDTLRRIAVQLMVSLADTSSPRLATVVTDEAELRRRLDSMLKIMGAISVTVAGGLALFGTDFLRLWLGDITRDPLVPYIVFLLACSMFSDGPRMVIQRSLRVRNRVGLVATGSLVEGIAVLLLGAILAPRYHALGVVLSRVVVSVTFALVALPMLFGSVAGVSRSEFWLHGVLRPLAAFALPGILCAWLLSAVRPEDWGEFMLVAAAGGLATIASVAMFGFEAEMRREVLNRFGLLRD